MAFRTKNVCKLGKRKDSNTETNIQQAVFLTLNTKKQGVFVEKYPIAGKKNGIKLSVIAETAAWILPWEARQEKSAGETDKIQDALL